MDVNEITKEQFDAACSKYPQTKFLKFMYTYYNTKLKRKPTPIGTWAGVIAWIIATIGLIVFYEIGMKEVATAFAWVYLPFAAFIVALPAFIINKRRNKKIANELGVTHFQYNYLVEKYYKSDEKYND